MAAHRAMEGKRDMTVFKALLVALFVATITFGTCLAGLHSGSVGPQGPGWLLDSPLVLGVAVVAALVAAGVSLWRMLGDSGPGSELARFNEAIEDIDLP
jgi:hypothetical protein